MSKAVVFFAEGTEECEALLVVDLLRRAKVEVTVASASGSREIVSSHKVHITADALAEEVDYSDVDMVAKLNFELKASGGSAVRLIPEKDVNKKLGNYKKQKL